MTVSPPTIHILCGFIASGKTTYAARVEVETGAIRFNLDEWMLPLFGEQMPRAEFDEKLLVLTDKFKALAEKLLAQNVSVILDFGFWTQASRAEITAWAQNLNATVSLVHFNTPREVCKARAITRTTSDAYTIDTETFDTLYNMYEPPSVDEKFDLIITDK